MPRTNRPISVTLGELQHGVETRVKSGAYASGQRGDAGGIARTGSGGGSRRRMAAPTGRRGVRRPQPERSGSRGVQAPQVTSRPAHKGSPA